MQALEERDHATLATLVEGQTEQHQPPAAANDSSPNLSSPQRDQKAVP
jgi:hypothetical protein